MARSVRFLFVLSIAAAACVHCAEAKEPAVGELPTELNDYVSAKDDAFAWKIRATNQRNGCLVYDIDLTSQVWQGITWKHAMSAFVPDDVRHTDTVLLFITGGSTGGRPRDEDLAMGAKLATLAQMPVAFLHQVPNQPLLGNRTEDDLISETFLRYLDTKDPKWPLLFPMVKSAVRAMDALEQIAEQEHGVEIERFVVTGGSKRGWTTWLSAVADERVAGIAPIVIDTLNFRPQMKHQMDTWGQYSEQIADYTSKGLVDVMEKKPEIPLWRWVDPYTYRSKLALPKLLINGTNDRYWVIDALNLYWDDLVGEKHVMYVPNAGHGLDDGKEAALTTLAVFAQHVAEGKSLPNLIWQHDDDGDRMRLMVQSKPAPQSVRLWVAKSDDKDFRPDRWNASEISAKGDGSYVAHVDKPASGHVAFFAEATYEYGPAKYNLSTQIRQE
jgi:PhoPQ-activated pathogenicity-related protein